MLSLLLLGVAFGMRHAFEADHVAAIATLTSQSRSLKYALKSGAVWGLGHTISLFVFGTLAIWMDNVVPATLAHMLEAAVGVMLIILGVDVLRRLIQDRVHFHRHQHGDTNHFHAHSHVYQGAHRNSTHDHQHPDGFPLRSLVVGLVHGMAGTAALVLLTLTTIQSPWTGMLYLLLFGFGSTVGMGILSVIIAVPLRSSAARLTWLHNALQATVGMLTIVVGGNLILQTGKAWL